MKELEYKCFICGGVFQRALTDAEVIEQLASEFPSMKCKPEQCELVCDGCFQKHIVPQLQ